jgi:mannose-1-phosphate guanylyltransferase/mannose-1-phosphate guanylyltransferase/mannose-6-phosphate isomerase
MKAMFDDCIIMAGGSGTRLWPASNAAKPKQFLPIAQGASGEDTFFTAALERALAVINKETGRVIIIAGEGHVSPIIRSCRKFSEADRKQMVLIPEPLAKNTAAAIACGMSYIDRVSGEKRNILVLTSDHIITPLEVFTGDAAAAAVFAQQDNLVVFGILPKAPETGYGYIEAAEPLESTQDYAEPYKPKVFQVASFREKPDRHKAEQFITSGHFYWNSGMFGFSSSYMGNEFHRHAPEVALPFDRLQAPSEEAYTLTQGLRVLSQWPHLKEAYTEAKNISFDYAIAEKCTQTVMVAAGFEWRDVGSWDEYARLLGETGAEVYRAGGESCFVDADIPVALCGVEDLIVVVRSGKDGSTPSALIAKKGETQRVREIVEKIKLAGSIKLL